MVALGLEALALLCESGGLTFKAAWKLAHKTPIPTRPLPRSRELALLGFSHQLAASHPDKLQAFLDGLWDASEKASPLVRRFLLATPSHVHESRTTCCAEAPECLGWAWGSFMDVDGMRHRGVPANLALDKGKLTLVQQQLMRLVHENHGSGSQACAAGIVGSACAPGSLARCGRQRAARSRASLLTPWRPWSWRAPRARTQSCCCARATRPRPPPASPL